MILSKVDYLILKTYALDDWDAAMDAFPNKTLRWYVAVTALVSRKFLEPMPIHASYRLTPDGWELADFAYKLQQRSAPASPQV